MLHGKYWLTVDGVADVTVSEHALYARRYMLGVTEGDAGCDMADMFRTLRKVEVLQFRRRGVAAGILEFLSQKNPDPRVYALREYGWVRVRDCRFYLWRLDDHSLQIIRAAKEYWKAQSNLHPHDVADVIELATDEEFTIPVKRLRSTRMNATALRAERSVACRPDEEHASHDAQ